MCKDRDTLIVRSKLTSLIASECSTSNVCDYPFTVILQENAFPEDHSIISKFSDFFAAIIQKLLIMHA